MFGVRLSNFADLKMAGTFCACSMHGECGVRGCVGQRLLS